MWCVTCGLQCNHQAAQMLLEKAPIQHQKRPKTYQAAVFIMVCRHNLLLLRLVTSWCRCCTAQSSSLRRSPLCTPATQRQGNAPSFLILSSSSNQRAHMFAHAVFDTSHLTPHTSHLTPHTSHLTPHTSRLSLTPTSLSGAITADG